jgi:hypothetical protein
LARSPTRRAPTQTDEVLCQLTEQILDLHALTEGPRGRELSTLLLDQLLEIGIAIVQANAALDDDNGFPLLELSGAAATMARRRHRSRDPEDAAVIIAMMAMYAVVHGVGPTTAIARPVLSIAAEATIGEAQVTAWAVWTAAFDVLGALQLHAAASDDLDELHD